MTHRITRLTNEHSDAYVNKLITNNVQLNETDYDPELIITDYRTVLKPNGELLLKLLPGAISVELASVAFREFNAAKLNVSTNSLRAAINTSANRGSDAVLGFMDPVPLFDFCRATAFTAKEMKAFRASLPFIRATAELMKIHTPDKYAAQMAACQNCLPDYIIPGRPTARLPSTVTPQLPATWTRVTISPA